MQEREADFKAQVMPNRMDRGLQASVPYHCAEKTNVQGPKLSNFEDSVLKLRKEGLLGAPPDQADMKSQRSFNESVNYEAMNGNRKNNNQPKTSHGGFGKQDKQDQAKEYPGDEGMSMNKYTQSDKSNFSQLGRTMMRKAHGAYICRRASGRSAGLQSQQSVGPEDDAETDVCCVCLEKYCWEDQKVFTKCCDIEIGSLCQASHIADTGECWNCGKGKVQSQAVSAAGSWVSYDPEDFAPKPPPLPLYAALITSEHAGRQPPAANEKLGSFLRNRSILGSQGFSTPNNTNTQALQSRTGKRMLNDLIAGQLSSSNLADGNVNRHGNANGGIEEAKIAPLERQFLYNGSESAGSELSLNDQQHIRGLTAEKEKEEAKQYVIEATKHLVKTCNTYGDAIDKSDTDEVVNEILQAVKDCKTFRTILGRAPSPAMLPASVESPVAVNFSDLIPCEEETYCNKCEELQTRMKKAADALLGL